MFMHFKSYHFENFIFVWCWVSCYVWPWKMMTRCFVFGPEPVGVGIGKTLSCLHNISWTIEPILNKLAGIYNWRMQKSWLDLSMLGIFLWLSAVDEHLYSGKTSVVPQDFYCISWGKGIHLQNSNVSRRQIMFGNKKWPSKFLHVGPSINGD